MRHTWDLDNWLSGSITIIGSLCCHRKHYQIRICASSYTPMLSFYIKGVWVLKSHFSPMYPNVHMNPSPSLSFIILSIAKNIQHQVDLLGQYNQNKVNLHGLLNFGRSISSSSWGVCHWQRGNNVFLFKLSKEVLFLFIFMFQSHLDFNNHKPIFPL